MFNNILSKLLMISLRIAAIFGKRNQSEGEEARLSRKLFRSDYNPELRPVVNRSDKVTVKLGVSLHQIINVVRVTSLLEW